MLSKPITYVIDDDPSVRASLEDLLHSVRMRVYTFPSVESFLAAEHELAPSCLVLDVRMPGCGGLEFQARLNEQGSTMPIIFISGHADLTMAVKAMKSGATEFLEKPFDEQALLDAINNAVERDRRRLIDEEERGDVERLWAELSEGEKAVCEGVVGGKLNKQIAEDLGLSEITIKVRRSAVMRKMKAENVVNLARLYDRITAPSHKAGTASRTQRRGQ